MSASETIPEAPAAATAPALGAIGWADLTVPDAVAALYANDVPTA